MKHSCMTLRLKLTIHTEGFRANHYIDDPTERGKMLAHSTLIGVWGQIADKDRTFIPFRTYTRGGLRRVSRRRDIREPRCSKLLNTTRCSTRSHGRAEVIRDSRLLQAIAVVDAELLSIISNRCYQSRHHTTYNLCIPAIVVEVESHKDTCDIP